MNHRISQYMGLQAPRPFAVALSPTHHCNSRCQLCNIWRDPPVTTELSLSEWDQIFAKMGSTVKIYTYTGGEPFLRHTLPELLCLPFQYGQPKHLTISTNGLYPERVHEYLNTMLRTVQGQLDHTALYCNVSVDGLDGHHDTLRGVDGNFDTVLQTLHYLRGLRRRHRQIKIGIHTVISRLNVHDIENVVDYFLRFPDIDAISCQLAEQRHELGTIHTPMTPSIPEYRQVIHSVRRRLAHGTCSNRTLQDLQQRYYTFVDDWLRTQAHPFTCYAGRGFCQITADGKVVSCGTRWLQDGYMGDLRAVNYDLNTLWHARAAKQVRTSIRNQECTCPLRTAYYTTMSCHLIPLAKMAFQTFRAWCSSVGGSIFRPHPPG